MSSIYDNWERLVAAVLKKQEIWELCHAPSRSSSFSSISSDFTSSSSFHFDDNLRSAKVEVEEPASRIESEWVEEYEVGVYLTLVASIDGSIEVTRGRFRRIKFTEKEAETWWLNNREKVYKKYNDRLSSNSKVHFLGKSEENRYLKRDDRAGSEKDAEKDVKSKNSGGSGGQFVDEWIEQYEPGVYITLGAFRDGIRDAVRLRFSRRRFKEVQAEAWWVKNWDKVCEKYNLHREIVLK